MAPTLCSKKPSACQILIVIDALVNLDKRIKVMFEITILLRKYITD